MAPPLKRRRLTKSSPSSSPPQNGLVPGEPSSYHSHSVQHLKHKSSPGATRKVPQRIEEVHLQIQERALGLQNNAVQLRRRQGAPQEVQTVATIDSEGNAVITTITVGEGAGAATSNLATTPTTSSTASTDTAPSGSSPSGTLPDGSSSNSTSPSTSPDTLPTTDLPSSQNSTDTSNTRQTGTGPNGTADRTSQTALPDDEFRATLSNDNTVTLTRSDKPYVTSFGNGDTLTICPSEGTCQLSFQTKPSTEDDASTQTTSTVDQNIVSTSSGVAYAGTAAQSTPTSPGTSSTTDVAQDQSDDSGTPPAGTIAGGVVGGAAGIAVILLIALIFLRWYKRRAQQRHHALPASSTMSPDPDYPPSSSRHTGMAERAGLRPLVGAVPGFFRHQNQSSEEPASSERGFTKVSGRKLPSAFSEGMSSGGMSSPPPTMPLTSTGSSEERNLSSLSFYQDRDGFHGGQGNGYEMSESPPRDHPSGREYGEMTLSPGPQRTPTVHHGGPYTMSPGSSVPSTPVHPAHRPLSPPETAGTQQTMMRSETPSSTTDNRSSRFTEEV